MPIGPGKYDDQATRVREETEAEGVMVVVVNGNLGGGFSVQGPIDFQIGLPDVLRFMADQIEGSLKGLKI